MTRRRMLAATAAIGAALPADEKPKSAFFELRYFRMRNSRTGQVRRTSDFLSKSFVPAAARAGIGPLGFFSGYISQNAPFILMLASYPSLTAMETALEKFESDGEYRKALDQYNIEGQPGFVRIESSLLRAFDAMPAIELPPRDPQRPARLYEMRTYESDTLTTLRRKIGMFAAGEIAIFRRCGLLPVFFGETIIGANMPNLTYMVAYDDWAAREKAWQAFGRDPEWQKMRVKPGLADAEIVSNVSNALLRPLPFSQVR